MRFYIATQDKNGLRKYLTKTNKFTMRLSSNAVHGTLIYRDAYTALRTAERWDALVLTEGKDGLVPI